MDNPNAFPTNDITPCHPGMTLRDWFAGQALAGLIAQSPHRSSTINFARAAFLCADAMLTERTKPHAE